MSKKPKTRRLAIITGLPMGRRSLHYQELSRLLREWQVRVKPRILNERGDGLRDALTEFNPGMVLCFGLRACIKLTPWERFMVPRDGYDGMPEVDMTFNPPKSLMSIVYCNHPYFNAAVMQMDDPMEYMPEHMPVSKLRQVLFV